MQTRPSTVHFRRCCVKRRTLRCAVLFTALAIAMLLCNMNFLSSLLLAALAVLLVRLIFYRNGQQ